MSEYDEIQVSEWLRDGIAAAKAGRRDEARELLMRVVELNEESEQGWLWLSGVVDADADRLICLENVLALNPDNVQARAGLRHSLNVQEQRATAELVTDDVPRSSPGLQADPSWDYSVADQRADAFMTSEGCVYCGVTVSGSDSRCPHCGNRLATKQYKKAERSGLAYLLHAYWILLAGLNLADFFLIGFVRRNIDKLPSIITDYLPYVVGNVISGETILQAFVETETLIQFVRFFLLALAILGALDALGLFLRRPLAHTLGVGLIALHLVMGLSLFAMGFLGYVLAAFRGVYTAMLTIFMFNTVEDFGQEVRHERLEPDRHLLNDADYYTRGRAYEKRGMWAKALLHWRRAAVMNPSRDSYYASMARAYAQLGRYEQALNHIDEALRVSRTPEEWQPLRDIIVEAGQRATGTADAF